MPPPWSQRSLPQSTSRQNLPSTSVDILHTMNSVGKEPCSLPLLHFRHPTNRQFYEHPRCDVAFYPQYHYFLNQQLSPFLCITEIWSVPLEAFPQTSYPFSTMTSPLSSTWQYNGLLGHLHSYLNITVQHRFFDLSWSERHMVPENCFQRWDTPTFRHGLDRSMTSFHDSISVFLYKYISPLLLLSPSMWWQRMCVYYICGNM